MKTYGTTTPKICKHLTYALCILGVTSVPQKSGNKEEIVEMSHESITALFGISGARHLYSSYRAEIGRASCRERV